MGKIAKKIKKCFVISKQIINFAPTKDNMMTKNNPKVAYLEEALSFIESIPKSASDKLLEEDSENAEERNFQGRENKTRIF